MKITKSIYFKKSALQKSNNTTKIAISNSSNFVVYSRESLVALWDPVSGRMIRQFLDAASDIISVDFSNCADFILAGCRDGEVYIWDANSGKLLREFVHANHSFAYASFSPNARQVAVKLNRSYVYIIDVQSGERLSSLGAGLFGKRKKYIDYLSEVSPQFLKNGNVLRTLRYAGARDWDVKSGKFLHKIELDSSLRDYYVSITSPKEKFILYTDRERQYLSDAASGERIETYSDGFYDQAYSLAFSNDEKLFATGMKGTGRVNIWSTGTDELVDSFETIEESVRTPNDRLTSSSDHDVISVCFDGSGNILASTKRNVVYVYSLKQKKITRKLFNLKGGEHLVWFEDETYMRSESAWVHLEDRSESPAIDLSQEKEEGVLRAL